MKQGYILSLILFIIYVVAVTLLSRQSLSLDDGVSLRYRLDGSVFNLRRLWAPKLLRYMLIHRSVCPWIL